MKASCRLRISKDASITIGFSTIARCAAFHLHTKYILVTDKNKARKIRKDRNSSLYWLTRGNKNRAN